MSNNCPLYLTATTTPTDYWNDSCSIQELTYAIENGAVGATTNPNIVVDVLKKEMPLWKDRIYQIISENSTWSEDLITWKLIEEMAVKGAALLEPVFKKKKHTCGRISIQTNPANYRNSLAIVEQAVHFDTLAPNIQVKIPATKAGIAAIEEATYRGVNINATVSFTVPQSIAVAEAVERGLNRRKSEGKDISEMTPVCTIMIGRLDDWLQVLMKRDGIPANPDCVHWAGIAVFKRAYAIFQERGFRTRLLVAAYRHHMHWSELIGGDIIQTIPYVWQVQFNKSDIVVIDRFKNPVSEEIIKELQHRFPDFIRAYEPDGLSVEEYDTFGPSVRTLRAFISAYHDLMSLIRDFMLPNPDIAQK